MSDKNTLLTSTTWEAPSVIDNKQNVEGTLSFAENGTYTETFNQQHSADELVMIGTWKWINENEISLVFNAMKTNGEKHDLDTKDSYILTIAELSREHIKVVKRHAGDSKNSGFEKSLTYVASAE